MIDIKVYNAEQIGDCFTVITTSKAKIMIETGEIMDRYAYLEPFYQVFSVETKLSREQPTKIRELKKMVEEFELASELMKEYTK